ncbi:MAG TPA: glycosyltransferase [Pirellulales bacterium]|nr:glycosyltransferase [Pirellulales bacterium]
MKIALVHDWLTGMRGGEKCLAPFCRRFSDAPLYTLLHARGRTAPEIERMQITTSFLQRIPGIERYYRYWLPLMPRAIESFQIDASVDLVLSFSHAVAKSVRPPPGVPHVCYCFTPMRYAWQLRGDYFGDEPSSSSSARRRAAETPRRVVGALRGRVLDGLRRWDRATADRVTHYVAISQTIRRRIADCYGRESTVIYPPVDTDFYTPGDVPREDFYLMVSALAPYKKVQVAVEACQRLRRRLVVIGAGPEVRSLARQARSTTQLMGWRSDEEIRDHLRRCRALLFPGHEDFGIVPVEAQACGAPVIAYERGGATETVLPADERRLGTGVFFGRQTPEALCEAMLWFERHEHQVSARLARRQALKFHPSRYEESLLHYLEQVAGMRGAPVRRAA